MLAWEELATTTAPDGVRLELRRRGHEYLIRAGGIELMSNQDESSSRSLGTLGCAHLPGVKAARVLVGGLGMGYTLRAALDSVPAGGVVEVAELVAAVVEWNRGLLADLAGRPLEDPRSELHLGDVRARMRALPSRYDAILLDVDNGPSALAHKANNALYSSRGLEMAWLALKPGGVFGVWSISDDHRFTARLKRQGFETRAERVHGSRIGRGRFHVIWLARKPSG
jgi:spermidine synthase